MKTMNYTEARNNLAQLMKEAESDRAPIAITRNGSSSVVLLLQDEYEGLLETLHLISTPANAERLDQAIAEVKAGKTVEHPLCD